ncbi:MAG: FAD:protein FMN transferase [Rubrivivax sp.]|nr:FAD:protein FMN transferase [Rubrivivax sp.]
MLQTALARTPRPPEPLRRIAASADEGGWLRRDEAIMGTAITVELWAEDARIGAAAAAAVLGEMHRIDRRMSPYKEDSELSRINREAFKRPVRVSEEIFRLLERALQFSALSQGAFDVTYAAVGRLYDYRIGVRPDDAALAAARAAVGWQHLQLDHRTQSVRFGRPGMCIDLGGFAKGHAVDNAIALLEGLGIRHAHVAAGGDSRVLGDRRGRPWSVAIRDPRHAAGVVAVLPLEDTAISTSGDYERYFEEPGLGGQVTRHHHLIDPATGRSPRGVTSVTVLAPDGLTAEALGKILFIQGPGRGLELLETLPGIDAVIIDSHGRLHTTPGLTDVGPMRPPAPQGEKT